MGIKKLLLEFAIVLILIISFIVILNGIQAYHNASERLILLRDQSLDDTYEIYRDKIIGDLLIDDRESAMALLQEIFIKRDMAVNLMYAGSIFQAGTFSENTWHKKYILDFGDGRKASLTLYSLSTLDPWQFFMDLSKPLILEILILGIGFFYLLWRVRKKLLDPLTDLVAHLTPEQLDTYTPKSEAVLEICGLSNTLKEMNITMQALYKAEIDTARQVAHDIRSPLTALELLAQDLPEVTEDKRITIKNAVDTLKDLASNTLQAVKRKREIVEYEQSEPIAILLERIISEKRIQLLNNIKLSLNIDDKRAYGFFARIDNTAFKRVISNLLNNAIDAVSSRLSFEETTSSYKGEVEVTLRGALHNGMEVIIQDNGCGIAQENIEQVLQGGISIGKKDGTGIGLSSSKQLIEACGGKLEIKSELNQGTTITIFLLSAPPALWFAQKLMILQDSEIIILDDDRTIHDVWDRLLGAIITPIDNIQIKHFYNPIEMMGYYASNRSKRFKCLIDYELINTGMTGLDVIEQLKLQNEAVLVTSRYEDIQVRENSTKLNIKILPKNFTPYVLIEIIPNNPDLILIDDYDSIRVAWKMYGLKKGKRVAVFSCIKDFEQNLSYFKKETPIYIDSILHHDEIPGEEYAKKLYDQGYRELYLETGRDIEKNVLEKWYWIKGVVDKTPPF